MALTRREINALAEMVAAIHNNGGVIGSVQLAEKVADVCAKSNPYFDRKRFYFACGVGPAHLNCCGE